MPTSIFNVIYVYYRSIYIYIYYFHHSLASWFYPQHEPARLLEGSKRPVALATRRYWMVPVDTLTNNRATQNGESRLRAKRNAPMRNTLGACAPVKSNVPGGGARNDLSPL